MRLSAIAVEGFVRNHYKPEATTNKLLLHIYGVGSSQASVTSRAVQGQRFVSMYRFNRGLIEHRTAKRRL